MITITNDNVTFHFKYTTRLPHMCNIDRKQADYKIDTDWDQLDNQLYVAQLLKLGGSGTSMRYIVNFFDNVSNSQLCIKVKLLIRVQKFKR